jgi:hypothetical protein
MPLTRDARVSAPVRVADGDPQPEEDMETETETPNDKMAELTDYNQ